MEWFSVSECVGIGELPTHPYNVRKRLESLSTPETKRKRQGTKAYEYHISILPVSVQAALLKANGKIKVGEQVLNLPKPNKDSVGYCREALWANWAQTNNKAKEKAQQTLRVVQATFALIGNGVKKMDAYQSVCDEYGCTLSTLRRACSKVKGFDECDWAPALLPKHFAAAQVEKENQFAPVSPEAWRFFMGDYLRLEQPSMTVCYERLLDAAKEHSWTVPSLKSLSRRLDYEVSAQQRVLLREGEHALHQMYPPQRRTVQDLHAMEWINGDGYQHNVFVKWFNGDVIRPKTWFWQDIYSRKIIGWRCDLSENTDSIRLSLMDVCEKYGIPKEMTLDNTRAAANKPMTGGVPNRYRFKVKEDDPKGIIPMLGIKLHWSSVIYGKGHGQAKPIERAFGNGGLGEYIDRHPLCEGAFTGDNPMAKPDNYGSNNIDVEAFLNVIAKGVEMYNAKENRNTEICRGHMSFDQAFNASYQVAPVRKATASQLHMMMLQAEAVQVSKHGQIALHAGGILEGRRNLYFNERMLDYIGQKVVARFDPQRLHESIEIYTLNGVHICVAECRDDAAFGDTQAAREIKKERTRHTKATKEAAKSLERMTALEVAAMMKPLEEEIIPENKVVEPFRPTSIGNTAVKAMPQEEAEDEYDQNFSESVACLMEQRNKNRL
ncbi:Mu transposase C-terminal domain-containing protein [Vibrio sp. DW001]|uniref:transposase domain-containing protein n=1 Tax=Vibrio sp. DW001 TaxID=2912315 RepID=UPI0023B08E84|nr:transposase domain-containing protein [Vibrio sp. DW001]WED29199.1 Mu transposase C-terminal domain-containing protein [Vibrio sp. DW001]